MRPNMKVAYALALAATAKGCIQEIPNFSGCSGVCGSLSMLGNISSCCTVPAQVAMMLVNQSTDLTVDCTDTGNATFTDCDEACISPCGLKALPLITEEEEEDVDMDCDSVKSLSAIVEAITSSTECANGVPPFVAMLAQQASLGKASLCGGTCPSTLVTALAPLLGSLPGWVDTCFAGMNWTEPDMSELPGYINCLTNKVNDTTIKDSCVACVINVVQTKTEFATTGKFPGPEIAAELGFCTPGVNATVTTAEPQNNRTTPAKAKPTSSASSKSAVMAAFAVVVANML